MFSLRCESGLHSAYSDVFVSYCVCTFLACIENTMKFLCYEITTAVALGRSQKGLGIYQEAFYRYARSGFGLYGFIVGHQLAQQYEKTPKAAPKTEYPSLRRMPVP